MNNKEICDMLASTRFCETGSAPYHLNVNNTAKEFSNQESTNPSNGLMELLNKHVIIEDNIILINPQIANNLTIIKDCK